ncbi:MAG TPA: ABC-F family ATP-binding cassette domain-containing protein [Acidimicrobiales bacterium]|nr:ABC-F family ATP-binding cassette domain-containing protein [Acidimicrobiales bacterium]
MATLVARAVTLDRGGHTVLGGVSLTVGPLSRIGMIGPNGVGKSSLLQVLAGVLAPDGGEVVRDPPSTTVGYLAQEHDVPPGVTVRELLAGRVGGAGAEAELAEAAAALAEGTSRAALRYEVALERFNRLGVADLDARIDAVLDDLGVGAALAAREASTLSGGQQAKVALAGIELSQFDITLLDEPTNDLDFGGLRRLEAWLASQSGGMVIVSHDRDFLARTVTSVVELDEHSRTGQEYGGGWSGYLAERASVRRHATEAYDRYDRRRSQLEHRAEQQRQWATSGVRREARDPADNDKAQRDFRINRTEKLAAKARQTDRARVALETVDKPWEGWDLRFTIEEAPRSGAVVARLSGAVIERGTFRMGPVDLQINWGDRMALTGANGTGKTSLVAALLGTLPLAGGQRWIGPSVVVGELGQDRQALQGHHDVVRTVMDRCGLKQSEARSLLAKFGLGADHVVRAAESLSPGERTRAELAMFQALGVNFLVLDEPTNHLDLPAIEQLEAALAGFGGTLLLVSHDRQLLDSVEVTRSLELT